MKRCLYIFLILASCLSLAAFAVPASGSKLKDAREEIELPVLMYHGLTETADAADEYNIPASAFESDLRWLSEHGFTSVSVSQLAAYTSDGSALPEKPVLITFDDGYYNNYALALPLLEKYHMKAVVSVIGEKADQSSGDLYRNLTNSSLSWGEIALLAKSGCVEIGNHTYALHHADGGRKGAGRLAGESAEDYANVLRADLSALQEKVASVTGSAPLLFAWPYGEYPPDGSADAVLKELGFAASVTSYQKTNVIKRGEPDSLFGLKRFLRTPDFDIGSIIC